MFIGLPLPPYPHSTCQRASLVTSVGKTPTPVPSFLGASRAYASPRASWLLLAAGLFGCLDREAQECHVPHQSEINRALGNCLVGTLIQESFTIPNSSEKALTITDIVKSCACNAVSVSNDMIPPGQCAQVKVEVDTTGKKPGPFTTSVRLLTDQQHPAFIMLRLEANLVERFSSDPSLLDLGVVHTHDTRISGVRIACNDPDFEFNERQPPALKSTIPNLTLRWDLLDARHAGLIAIVDGPPETGFWFERVEVAFKACSFSLPVRLRVEPRIEFVPREYLDFGQVLLRSRAEASIAVRALDANESRSFRVTNAFAEPWPSLQESLGDTPIADVTVTESDALGGFSVHVRLAELDPQDMRFVGGRVIIETNHPDVPLRAIPFRAHRVDKLSGGETP